MVLTLIGYIGKCLVNYRLANRECSITALPRKVLIYHIKRLNPPAAVALHFLNKMCHILVLRQQTNYVYVVRSTPDTYNLASCGVDQLTDITMYAVYVLIFYLWTVCLDMEDDM